MTQRPWRQTFPAMDLARSQAMGLTLLEDGAWRRLRDMMWLEPTLSLPLDDVFLRRRSGMTPRQWAAGRERILSMFMIVQVSDVDVDKCGKPRLRIMDEGSNATYFRQLNGVNRTELMNEVRRKSLRGNKSRSLSSALADTETEKERSSITSNRARAIRAGQNDLFASEPGKGNTLRLAADAISPERTPRRAEPPDLPPPEAEDPRPPDHPARVAGENLGAIDAVVRDLETQFRMPASGTGRRR
jgi:hypothetical protein